MLQYCIAVQCSAVQCNAAFHKSYSSIACVTLFTQLVSRGECSDHVSAVADVCILSPVVNGTGIWIGGGRLAHNYSGNYFA